LGQQKTIAISYGLLKCSLNFEAPNSIERIRDLLDIPADAQARESQRFFESIPFSINDATAGCEDELQAVVIGRKENVDLPLSIIGSSYYHNIAKRSAAGDISQHLIESLNDYLDENAHAVWENSWVRFPRSALSHYANTILENDLSADKAMPGSPQRGDAAAFLFNEKGAPWIRVPISYFLKLSLADAISTGEDIAAVRAFGTQCLGHFLNDNTSPETFSFHPVPVCAEFQMGRNLARESLKRFLLCQVLAMYGNAQFRLLKHGQEAQVYFSPHPPVRQKRLNNLLSDAFYRELFMSPCLSGWDQGEAKHRYMHLCHEVLSRSQLNAVIKLKEAHIITRNLVVLPNLSNVSLANNGTHISIGSRKLTRLLQDPTAGFSETHEKHLGDLVIKIVEHFLPLFVGTYSAAPYRLDFWDFHPEKVLGYLPHELDYTHLRMIWRRWKKKANLKLFGHPLTPFGPDWLDRFISKTFQLKGDFVNDFRLIDYLVSLMSTEQSPALNGRLDSEGILKKDLARMGIFDSNMSLYLLFKQRRYASMGFSGFEGRYYSVFENIAKDMTEAVNLQVLLTAFAYELILSGRVTHGHIPDSPFVESERRQVFFGAAIGIPTFYILKDTPNTFMKEILKKVKKTRQSRRYPGYVRVHNIEYRKVLLEILRTQGAPIVELLGLRETLNDLERRVRDPKTYSAAGRLTEGILEKSGASSPLKLSGDEFNLAAERFYRETLRERHIIDACNHLMEDIKQLTTSAQHEDFFCLDALKQILGETDASDFLVQAFRDLNALRNKPDDLRKIIHLLLLTIACDTGKHKNTTGATKDYGHQAHPSIH
jgi:hypothetical protein